VAEAQHTQALEQLRLVLEGAAAEQLAVQRAVVLQAEAALEQARVAVDRTRLVAPFAGIVTVRHRQSGETTSPGAPVVTLMDPDDRWVRIYVPGDVVGRVALGQSARISSDSHPDSTFAGRVTHVASEAEFTPRNVQTSQERVKLVYAVKVAIDGDPGLALKPGMPADVRLVTGPR
jgi:HlyD family secretion protein